MTYSVDVVARSDRSERQTYHSKHTPFRKLRDQNKTGNGLLTESPCLKFPACKPQSPFGTLMKEEQPECKLYLLVMSFLRRYCLNPPSRWVTLIREGVSVWSKNNWNASYISNDQAMLRIRFRGNNQHRCSCDHSWNGRGVTERYQYDYAKYCALRTNCKAWRRQSNLGERSEGHRYESGLQAYLLEILGWSWWCWKPPRGELWQDTSIWR